MEAEDKAVTVYAVVTSYDYEGYGRPVIFSSLEKAMAYAKSDRFSKAVDDVEVREIALDGEDEGKEVWSRRRNAA